jgi:uncharacterized protein (DUF1800 family)
MGREQLSRRNFFKTLRKGETPVKDGLTEAVDTEHDPLFDKYARKSLGARVYKNELVSQEAGRGGSNDNRVGNVTSGLSPYTGTWGETEALFLLRRTGYGVKKSYVDSLLPMTVSQAVDYLLTIDNTPPAPPVNWYENIQPDQDGVPYGADWTNSFFATNAAGQNTNIQRNLGMRRWLYSLTLNSDHTIREKMVWFWYHFIPVDFDDIYQTSNSFIKSNSARVFYRYFKLLRDNSLGNFKTLIRLISTEPAMMYYLNNQQNSAAAPDENYARELMELFTLGKDPASQYTQQDVVEAAKVLTGWRVQNLNTANFTTNFVSAQHSTANKQFSSFFNNTVISYQSGANGANELDQLVNMIFSKTQVVSEYICRRLYRYFVYYDIDANIEANVIVPLAQTFVNSNWDIVPVLKKLFKSEHFFDLANRGVFIKTPFDLVTGAFRSFNVNTTVSDPANYEAQYRVWGNFNDTICSGMEQRMGSIPNVSGWNPFYQTPAYYQNWINSNTIQKRFKFLNDIFNGYNLNYNGLLTTIKVDVIAYVQPFGNTICADPNLLVSACIRYLLPVDLSIPKQEAIKLQTLLSGQTTDSYWTTAWNNYLAAPTNTTNLNTVTSRLKSLLTSLVQLAEYQLI